MRRTVGASVRNSIRSWCKEVSAHRKSYHIYAAERPERKIAIMSNEEDLLLHPVDLCSKWGFDDGDICGPPLWAWSRSTAWAEHYQENADWEGNPARFYITQAPVLTELVRRHLKPLLPPGARLFRISTVHNTVRAEPDADPDSDGYDDALGELEDELGQINPVLVTAEEFNNVCAMLFPHRSSGWLQMHATLSLSWSVHTELADLLEINDGFDRGDIHRVVTAFVEACASSYSDDELRLAAEMITGRPDLIVEDIHVALRSCKALLR